MNKIMGSVQLRESGVGIPRLLVTAYDTYSRAISSPPAGTLAVGDEEARWNRLGSVVTGIGGTFDLGYEVDGQNGNCTQRPDLVLILSAPEVSCTPCQEAPTRIATCVRRNAASVENFVIILDEAQLLAAGIPVPRALDDVEELIKQRRSAAQRQERLRAEAKRIFVEKLQQRREFERLSESQFDVFMSALSAVPMERRNVAGARYVPRGASVQAANEAIIRSGIESRINRAAAVGIAALSDEQAAQFRDANGQFFTAIRASDLEPHLRPQHLGRGPVLIRKTPSSLLCYEGPVDPCIKILEGEEPGDEDQDEPTEPTPEPGLVMHDIPLLIETLVKDMTSPESASVFKVQSRAEISEVQKSVDGVTLHGGPADAPSLHDFHHLQIAFEHVWQELFDDDVTSIAKDLYADLVEVGQDPNQYLFDWGMKTQKIDFSKGKKAAKEVEKDAEAEPFASVISAFDITPEQWAALTTYQKEMGDIAQSIKNLELGLYSKTDTEFGGIHFISETQSGFTEEAFQTDNEHWLSYYRIHLAFLRRRGERIIGYAEHKVRSGQKFNQFHDILADLEKRMKEPYRFSIYAAHRMERSVNFGVVATYRQKWEPVNYQVGELVKTIPLAPKEVRRFTKKVAIRKSRAEKEVENNLHVRKTESTEIARAETEIIQKAQKKTNFQMSAEGGVNIGIAEAKGKTAFAQDAATESQETKKEFREAVFKAAEEYKAERTVEINVSTAEEFNFEESGEISNPNDEIPVTYLFYELQRRFRVSEQIHRVMPIVLVAQEFPTPDEINEDWIIAHDWILRRVILDDSFIPAMNYLASKVVGDEYALQEMYLNLQQQRRIADEIKEELVAIREQTGRRYAALQTSVELRADAIDAEKNEGFLEEGVEGLFGGSGGVSAEGLQVREDAAKDAYERAAKEEKELLGRLERETTALSTLSDTYTKNLSDHLNRREQISRLRVHLKANIMYYMQAIWSQEPPDQRFFRLHQVRVPKLQGTTTYTLEIDQDAVPMLPDLKKPYKMVAHCNLDPNLDEYDTLAEVADLDNLLGFKGNYMMFPLKQSNVLTDFMMSPYLDPVMGLRDPDPLGDWTIKDLVKYTCCLKHRLSKRQFQDLLPGLREVYRRLLTKPGSDGEEIIVPTGSLFIEALPGAHPILEDFKLFHRVVDVKKVQAEVRAMEFENVRMAARLLEGEREDPTIEKKVVIEGGTGVIVAPDDI